MVQIPQKLCGYLMWLLQFYWYRVFDPFSLFQAVFPSVSILLFHIIGTLPCGASTRAMALISTCVDMTGISSVVFLFLYLFSFFLFFHSCQLPLACCTHSCPQMLSVSPPNFHSLSSLSVSLLYPSPFCSVPLTVSPYQGFLINGEP